MAEKSLQSMAAGGVYDHVGGGFHRYSVDEHWHVPHFEKVSLLLSPLRHGGMGLQSMAIRGIRCQLGRHLPTQLHASCGGSLQYLHPALT